MTGPVTLVAVVGPVEPALLTAWCAHYQTLGVQRFAVALHNPTERNTAARDHLAQTFRAATGHRPLLMVSGPWHEHTNGQLRDQLRSRAGEGWHLLADADEFQQHPHDLATSVATARAAGGLLGGLLLDRVAPNGSFPSWAPATGLDRTYPLGGLLTHELLRGDLRKVVLAHSSVVVASGNHRAPGHRPPADQVVAVHHFKWRAGVVADLRERIEKFRTGAWTETTPAVRHEAQRLLTHLADHQGRLALSGTVAFHPVTLTTVPPWWRARSREVVQGWRPPHPPG